VTPRTPGAAGRPGWVPGERLVRRAGGAPAAGDDAWDAPLDEAAPAVGVLALQGDVLEHLRALRRVGARPVRVRRAEHLEGLAGIVLPGGESTTIGKMLVRFDLLDPLRDAIGAGLPAFGTCAGMILLATELEQDFAQPLLGVLDVRVRRNAFGRQVDSFDTSLEVAGVDGGPVDVSFIRAPWVERVLSDDVEVLASVEGHPVVVRQGHVLAVSFHPEVTGDDRIHAAWVASLSA
jgi:pyridoxal 5'-phosphate synthase pdxT subunit